MKQSKAFNNNQNNNSANLKSRNVFVGNTYESNKKQIVSQTAPKTENDAEKKPEKVKKKPAEISKLVAIIATAITGTAIVTGAGIGGLIPTSPIKANYFEVFTSEYDISYYAELDGYNLEEDEVYIMLYNDFTNRTQKFEEQMMEGTFENLQPNMTYTIAIKHGNIVIASKVVKTVIQEDEYYDDTGQDEPITEDPTTSDGNEDQGGYTTNG